MDALPACCCSGLLVPRAGWINWAARSQNHGGGLSAKTVDRAVEICHRRHSARRSILKACCLIGPSVRPALRPQSSPMIRGNVAVVRHGAYSAVYTEWCRSLGALPVPNAGQWLGSTPAVCEVCRGSPAENESPTLDRDLPKSALDGETIM